MGNRNNITAASACSIIQIQMGSVNEYGAWVKRVIAEIGPMNVNLLWMNEVAEI